MDVEMPLPEPEVAVISSFLFQHYEVQKRSLEHSVEHILTDGTTTSKQKRQERDFLRLFFASGYLASLARISQSHFRTTLTAFCTACVVMTCLLETPNDVTRHASFGCSLGALSKKSNKRIPFAGLKTESGSHGRRERAIRRDEDSPRNVFSAFRPRSTESCDA